MISFDLWLKVSFLISLKNIEDRGPGAYGFTSFEDQFQLGASYMLIDDEYEASDYHIPGINTMRLTVAHEFFHAIQSAYRAYPSEKTTFFSTPEISKIHQSPPI